ncbi:MAG: DUF748 domain-containing protein [Anaeromyxobacteraceae bacterium]
MRRIPRAGRIALAVLGVLVLLAVAVRLAADPLMAWQLRKGFSKMHGMAATFEGVHVRLLDLTSEVRDLRITKEVPGGHSLPYLTIPYVEVGLYWRELVRGHVVADIRAEAPRINLVAAHAKARQQTPKEAPEVARGVQEATPLRIDRLQVKDGELRFTDLTEPEHPRLRVTRIEGTLENWAFSKALAEGQPTVIAIRGLVQGEGKLTFFATADPLAKTTTFAGQGELVGLPAGSLAGFAATKSDVVPRKGTLDVYVRFVAKDGEITGGVRPVAKGMDLEADEPGLGPRIKEALGDATLKLLSDDVPGREAVATTVPIRGKLSEPDVQAVPAIIGVLRNAFVEGLVAGVGGLPQPTAKKREGVLEQARKGLSRKREPAAQPEGGK